MRRSVSREPGSAAIPEMRSCGSCSRRPTARRSSCCAGRRALRLRAEMRTAMANTTGWLALLLTFLLRDGAAQGRVEERWPLDPGGAVRILNPVGRGPLVGWGAGRLAGAARL